MVTANLERAAVYETLTDPNTPIRTGDFLRIRSTYSVRGSTYAPARLAEQIQRDPKYRVVRFDDTFRGRSINAEIIPEVARSGGTIRDIPEPDGFDIYIEVVNNPIFLIGLVGFFASVLAYYVRSTVREVQRGRVKFEEQRTVQLQELAKVDRDRVARGDAPLSPEVFKEVAGKAAPGGGSIFKDIGVGAAGAVVGALALVYFTRKG